MKMLSLFFDNGNEFINHLLVQTINQKLGVDVARGRAGKSNDQCHIEQKNNTFVRSVFGNVRIENPDLVPMMNEIYEVWGKLHNYFMPQMKLISKERINGKVNSETSIEIVNDKKSSRTFISYKVSDTAIRRHVKSEKGHFTMGGRHYTYVKLEMKKSVFDQLVAESKGE